MEGLVKEVRQKQPNLIVVDRAVPGPYQNYLTPENQISENGLPYPWETCMPMATSWSYVPADTHKPTNELVEKLVDIVSKGGNFLLNIGPGPDGALDTAAYTRLREMGTWIKTNGEATMAAECSQRLAKGHPFVLPKVKTVKHGTFFCLITQKRPYCSPKSPLTPKQPCNCWAVLKN